MLFPKEWKNYECYLLKILFNKIKNSGKIMSELYTRKRNVSLITIVNNMINLTDNELNEKRHVKSGRDRKSITILF